MSKTTELTGGLLFCTYAKGVPHGGGVHGILIQPGRTLPPRYDGGDNREVLLVINGSGELGGDDCRRTMASRFREWASELEEDCDLREQYAARDAKAVLNAVDEDTYEVAIGALELDVKMARKFGYTLDEINARWPRLEALYRELFPAQPSEHPTFHECAACAAKSGSPVLCASCIHNRRTILMLENRLSGAAR